MGRSVVGGRKNSDRDGGAGILTKLLNDPKSFKEAQKKVRQAQGGGKKSKGPETFPNLDPPLKRGPNHMTPSGDKDLDRQRLREALHDKIDEVSDGRDPTTFWSGAQRRPCMSAVWDRESGRVYYNHNTKGKVLEDPDGLHPILKDRYDEYKKGDGGTWKQYEPNQKDHGEPGTHSETRATNEALLDAETDYAKGERRDKPKLDDFMVDNANPSNKDFMPCCPQCTQMIDGVDGADAGWDKDEQGNKKHRTGKTGL
ncbi:MULTISPECIES: YwqJ-related putative deaminase [Glycomyces]|uniref:YwqJ-like deaminase n=1 Tax=Glycomyces artemisiae TaxID=1076443 RepID=A0A2T0UNN6_9ACTN|nr:YwqJ-related putative deaminase [Glycomyces artemisiae]PRY59530.1 YwqJ-like deaminase [Glycomyces artemisiae]